MSVRARLVPDAMWCLLLCASTSMPMDMRMANVSLLTRSYDANIYVENFVL